MITDKATAAISGPAPARLLGWRGNMFQFFGDPLTYMLNARRDHGNVVAFTRGGNGNMLATIKNCPGTVFGFGPTCNQQILTQANIFQSSPMATTQLNHPATNRLLSGIFSMNGEKHKQQRRLMMPAFHKKRIEAYRDDMVAMGEQMLAGWQSGTQRDIHADLMHLTLQIACKTLFGVEVKDNHHNLGSMIQKWTQMNVNPAIRLKIDVPGTPYYRFARAAEQLDAEFKGILKRKRENGDEGDVLSMLANMRDENGEGMTEDELIGQSNILFFAGHETTANALTWTLFLLSQHPDIYANVMEELEGVLHGDAPTVDQLGQLELMDRVIKESMRVLPPVPFLLRVAMEDTELDGHEISAMTEVIFSQYITHHMPELYSEPERFNPDRWLSISPSPYEYLPFGASTRMCIGASFASMESKILLAMMLQHNRLELLPNAQVDRQVMITMAPKNGLMMQLQPPDKHFSNGRVQVQGNINEMVKLN